LSFRKAHHIVSDVVTLSLAQGLAANEITLSIVNESARRHIGRDTSLSEETLREALDPVHFVEIRSLPGGPSPKEINRMIDIRMNQYHTHVHWLGQAQSKIEQALQHLDQVIIEWSVS
jgi:argininosuccinate lyase